MKIAILGAESTGKSTLCHALAASMREAGSDVVVPQAWAAADADSWPAMCRRAPHADLDTSSCIGADAPQRRRTAVTQHGMRSAAKDRCHPSPVSSQSRSPDGVDPAHDWM